MNRNKKILLWFIPVLCVAYLLGPRERFENNGFNVMATTQFSGNPENLMKRLDGAEKLIKPSNESKIIWADTLNKSKTGKVILYLHGFSASPQEGLEFATTIGKKWGCNVYLPRLAQHGLKDVDAFESLTPEAYIQSAKEAMDFCSVLGDSIILMSCSTGATLGLVLAARGEPVFAHFMYSPNIAINDKSAGLLLWPWGKQMGKLVLGSEYHQVKYTEEQSRYWYDKYHMNGIIALQTLLEDYMTPECFAKIKHPVFMVYYFRDEEHQDDVVSVEAMEKMFDQLGTSQDKKEKIAFPKAETHMIISPMFSKQMEDIEAATLTFGQKIGLQLSQTN